MTETQIELRQPAGDRDSLRAYWVPIVAAFGETFDEAEFEADLQIQELDRVIGAVDGEAWVGGGSAYSFRLTVPGRREIGAAGITGVGVRPDHRRRRILTRVMRWLLDQAAERGEPVAVLHASEGAIYPNFGYGLATLQGTIDIARSDLVFREKAESRGVVRLVEPDEALTIIPALYDQARVGRPGEVDRSTAKWRAHMLADSGSRAVQDGRKFRIVLDVDGEPRGYAIYRIKAEWDERGPRHAAFVMEVTGLDAAAEQALWEWIAGIDLVDRIKGRRMPVPSPLFLQLTDMRRLSTVVGDGMWLRVVDLVGALQGRSYAGSGLVTFELTDAFIPANAGRWRIEITGGDARVTRTDAEPDLLLDIADLGAVYLGAFTFADLSGAGRVRECRAGATSDADRLFATNAVAWSSTPF